MSTVLIKHRLLPEEYLALENSASSKSEYCDGEVHAMAGAGYAHTVIASRTLGQLYMRLMNGTCLPLNPDMRVHVPATQFYAYPDVTIVCGTPQFADAGETTVVNPRLIVEVLSPSSEHYDRAEKFWNYQSIDSLSDYILIAQSAPLVEHFYRQTGAQSANQWIYTAYKGLEAILQLSSLHIEIPLHDIYKGVTFATVSEPSGEI